MIVNTQILQVDLEKINPGHLQSVTRVLRDGGIIVYPTETFYGLGANCFDEKAVRRVYRIKRRPLSKPLSVVVSDLDMIQEIVLEIPPVSEPLISEFWPGPLTLVLKASPRVPQQLQSASGSIGVRLTGHKWLRSLVKHASFPITATSANISGGEDIVDPEKAAQLFNQKVDLIVDGGETKGRLPSTVLDLSGKKPRIIREGAISWSQLQKYLAS